MSKRFIWKKACGDDESLLEDTHTNAILTIEHCLRLLNKQDNEVKTLKKEVNQLTHENKRLLTIVNNYRSKYE